MAVIIEVQVIQQPTGSSNGSVDVYVVNHEDAGHLYWYKILQNGNEIQASEQTYDTLYFFNSLPAGSYTARVENLTTEESAQEPFVLTDTVNHPEDGTFMRIDCNGVNRQQVVANGFGGERWGPVVEYNSATCGYVAPPPDEEEPGEELPGGEEPQPESPTSYTETITIQVQPCRPGVLLRWFNSVGGVESWLFAGKTTRPYAVEEQGTFLYTNGLRGTVRKIGAETTVVRTSGLNLNQYRALCEVYTSPKVWMIEDEQEREVYVLPASIDPDPYRKSYDLVVEVVGAPANQIVN